MKRSSAHMDNIDEQQYRTPFSSSAILPMLMLSLASQRHTPTTKNSFKPEYDYIVVGAGAAGSVVASRLSEMPCVSVLLLEAGKPTPLLTEVPSIGRAFVFSDINWMYRTTPQRHTASALVNREVNWPLGKTVGGSSAINGLIYVRGNRKNYDDWAAGGATGWSYDEVFPYFLKLEDNADIEFLTNGFHTNGGPVTASRPRYQPAVKRTVIEAAQNLGYNFVDPNGPTQHGFYDHQATMRRGQRCSAAKAYLVPSENRTNLDILARARVTKVLIENRTAVGVQFDFGGITHQVKAVREVIVSAGAVNTPQLLMLSGIGPMSELDRFKIPFVADLPVGLNLQDHIAGILNYVLKDKNIEPIDKRLLNKENIETYINSRIGPLASTTGIHLTAFLSNNLEKVRKDIPDFQLYFLEINSFFAKTQVGYTPEVFKKVFGPYLNESIHLCLSQILHPKSRGSVRLRTTNPYDPPDIDPNYFDHPQDLQDVVEGMKVCSKILSSPEMSQVGSELFNTTLPGCERFRDDLDLFLKCNLRGAVITISHPAGTAKMGDPTDPTTVVDPELRVKGVMGLRVVDASIMPTVVWGNTNIPTMMIAEKASDMIKKAVACHRT